MSSQVRAWGHGPFNGNVSIPDPQTVVLTVNDLPPNLFVEGSIVFPNRSVPAAYLQPKDQLPAILANEQRLADDTNKTRHRHDSTASKTTGASGAAQYCPSSLAFLIHEPGDRACEALRLAQHEGEHDQAKYLNREPSNGDPGEQEENGQLPHQ